jgi:hypothetical protein
MLIKSNIINLKIKNVLIPAKYGSEKSGIKYTSFIIKTSGFLLVSFLNRIYNKYIKRFNILGVLYPLAISLSIIGLLLIFNNIQYFIMGLFLLSLSLFLDYYYGLKK